MVELLQSKDKRDHFDPLGNGFGFTVQWFYYDDYPDTNRQFKVYEISTISDDGFEYLRDDWDSSADHVANIEDAEVYVEGFVKWDGCSEYHFGHLHFCCPRDSKAHIALMEYLYKRAFEVMGRDPEEEWDESENSLA